MPEECLGALLAWRAEADQRLIDYETRSVEREAALRELVVAINNDEDNSIDERTVRAVVAAQLVLSQVAQ